MRNIICDIEAGTYADYDELVGREARKGPAALLTTKIDKTAFHGYIRTLYADICMHACMYVYRYIYCIHTGSSASFVVVKWFKITQKN